MDTLAGFRVFSRIEDKGADQSAAEEVGHHFGYSIAADQFATGTAINRQSQKYNNQRGYDAADNFQQEIHPVSHSLDPHEL